MSELAFRHGKGRRYQYGRQQKAEYGTKGQANQCVARVLRGAAAETSSLPCDQSQEKRSERAVHDPNRHLRLLELSTGRVFYDQLQPVTSIASVREPSP